MSKRSESHPSPSFYHNGSKASPNALRDKPPAGLVLSPKVRRSSPGELKSLLRILGSPPLQVGDLILAVNGRPRQFLSRSSHGDSTHRPIDGTYLGAFPEASDETPITLTVLRPSTNQDGSMQLRLSLGNDESDPGSDPED